MMLRYLIHTSITRYSKNYGSLIHETRIKDAVNMGGLICLLATVRTLKGCGMGPLLVLVSPCFRENVVVTCKIGSFLCSLDTLLKNVIVFFFGNQISKWRSFEKRSIFGQLFTFFSHQRKVAKIPSARISLTYIHVFCHPIGFFLPYQL